MPTTIVSHVMVLNVPNRPPGLIVVFEDPGVLVGDELWQNCEEGPPLWFKVCGVGFLTNHSDVRRAEMLLRPVHELECGTKLQIRRPKGDAK